MTRPTLELRPTAQIFTLSLLLLFGGAASTAEDLQVSRGGNDATEEAFPGRDGIPKTAVLLHPDGSQGEVIHYEEIEGVAVFQGDVLLHVDDNGFASFQRELLEDLGSGFLLGGGNLVGRSPEGSASPYSTQTGKAAGRTSPSRRWKGNIVYYEIDPALPKQHRVHNAIADWQAKTALRFYPRTSQRDYLYFRPVDSGCYVNSIGRQGGQQKVSLENGCSTGTTIHEIGHAVGLFHEQTRKDRDQTVAIKWGNIQDGKASQFRIYSAGDGADLTDYDPDSIMHYPCYAFSKNGKKTIRPLRKVDALCNRMGQRSRVSKKDAEGIGILYPRQHFALFEAPVGTEPSAVLSSHSPSFTGEIVDIAAVDHDGDGVDEIAVLRLQAGNDMNLYIYEATADFNTAEPVGANHWDLPDNGTIAIAGVDHDGDGVDEIAALKNQGGNFNLFLYEAPVGVQNTPQVGANFWALPDGGTFDIAGVDHDGDGVDEIAALKDQGGDLNVFLYEAPVGTQDTPQVGASYWALPDGGTIAIAGVDHDGDGVDEIAALKDQGGDLNLFLYEAPVGTQNTPQVGADYWGLPDGGAFTLTGVDHDGDGVEGIAVVKR